MQELLKQTQAYLDYIKKHYACVQEAWALIKEKCSDMDFMKDPGAVQALDREILAHDVSKLSAEEFVPYRCQFFPVDVERTERVNCVVQELFRRAWKHHQEHNPHHWQNWTQGADRSTQERHCIHMVIDWVGMALQRNVPLPQYYREHKDEIIIPPWAHALVEDIFVRLEGEHK